MRIPSLLSILEFFNKIPSCLKQPNWYPLYFIGCKEYKFFLLRLIHDLCQNILKYAMLEAEIELLSETVSGIFIIIY